MKGLHDTPTASARLKERKIEGIELCDEASEW